MWTKERGFWENKPDDWQPVKTAQAIEAEAAPTKKRAPKKKKATVK